MKKIIPFIVILFVLFLQFKAAAFLHLLPLSNPAVVQEAAIDWQKHLDKAYAKAMKEKKPLFLYFEKKNSPWCMKMQKEILENREFIQEMKDLSIFARLDVEQSENESSLFRVRQTPAVILLDVQNGMVSQISYLPFTGKEYAREIKKIFSQELGTQAFLQEKRKQMGDQFISQREGEAKKNVPLFYSGRFFSSLLGHYAELLEEHERNFSLVLEKRKEIEDLDPQNHLGLHLRLAFLEFAAISKKSNAEMAIAPLLHYIDHFGKKEKEHLWLVQMTIAQFLFQKGEKEKALIFARSSYSSAPLPIKKELAETIRYLKEKVALSKSFPRDDME